MSHTWVIVRIGLALAAIFSLGVWAGRMTAPSPIEVDHPAGPGDVPRSPQLRKVVDRYRQEVGLSEVQLEAMREGFLENDRKMRKLPRNSAERLEVIEQFHRDIAPLLTEEQQRRADALLEEARVRHLR